MKKILFLTWTPFFSSDYKKYDLDTLGKKNKILIFDISQILYKNFNINKIYKKKNQRIKTTKYKNLDKLILDLKKTNFNLVINATGLEGKNKIFDTILEKKINIISIYDYKNYETAFFPKKLTYFFKYIFKLTKNLIFKNSFNEIVLLCSDNIDNKIKCLGKKTILSHSFGFDYFLREKNIKKKNEKNVAYVDSGFGFHPDFFLTKGINKTFDIKSYSTKINFLFKEFKKLGYENYFLAHPKVDKGYQKIYKNCKFIQNNTHKYIKNSNIVIISSSSLIDLAIIYKKKILRIFSKEMKSYPENLKDFKALSKFFQNQYLNLDNIVSNENIFKKILKPSKLYDSYFDKYIKHPKSKNVKYSDIFQNFLR